uniref:Dolichyl-phosphate beta-glucosyltransferase n=1 Tax=Daphnia similis TaxID=35528 RepID=A0A4Y7N024_9CRUS|nr:EOG090X0BIY [Daphnia similis]
MLLLGLLLVLGCATLVMLLFIYLTSETYAKVIRFKDEQFYLDPKTAEKQRFPSIEDESTIWLSVIVPAYNEEKRLPVMLEECLDYLEKKLKSNPSCTFEVLIVDDGSNDRTTEVGLSYSKKYGCDKVRVLTLSTNRGKGGAVRLGMLSARGEQLLFADADGATTFEDISKLQNNLKELVKDQPMDKTLGLVCGSRAHLEKEAIASRSFFRTVLMKGFHLLVWLFAARSVRDTQCGFKLLTRPTARLCFPNLHIERWAFDVELIYIAEYMKIPTGEVSVRWMEIEGKKIHAGWRWLWLNRKDFNIFLKYRPQPDNEPVEDILEDEKSEKKKKKKKKKNKDDEAEAEADAPQAPERSEEADEEEDDKKNKKDKSKKKVDPKKEKKGGPGKKALAAMQETLRKIKEEEERIRREEEEAERKAAEEERIREEQERKEQERRELRKQREKEKKERLKAEGKFLTPKQRAQQARSQASLEELMYP